MLTTALRSQDIVALLRGYGYDDLSVACTIDLLSNCNSINVSDGLYMLLIYNVFGWTCISKAYEDDHLQRCDVVVIKQPRVMSSRFYFMSDTGYMFTEDLLDEASMLAYHYTNHDDDCFLFNNILSLLSLLVTDVFDRMTYQTPDVGMQVKFQLTETNGILYITLLS